MAPRRGEAPRAGQARRRDRGLRLPARARSGPRLEGARRTRSSRRPSGPTPRPRTSCARSTATRLRDNPETGLKKGDLVAQGRRSEGRRLDVVRLPGSTRASSPTARTSPSAATRRPIPGGLGLYPGFGWTWPNNMRILYNRASCDRNGKPYPGSKPIVWWDEKAKRWTGYDVPDVPVLTDGPDTPNGQRAFHLSAEGVGRLFAAVYSDPDPRLHRSIGATWPTCRRTARCRRCTSPSRARSRTSSTRRSRATRCSSTRASKSHQPIGTVDKFPYVLMTSTVAEHWCARLDDAQHPVAERARSGAGARDARRSRQEARGQIGGLGRRSPRPAVSSRSRRSSRPA